MKKYILTKKSKMSKSEKEVKLYFTGKNTIIDSVFRPGLSENKKDAMKFKTYDEAAAKANELIDLIQFHKGYKFEIETF